MLLLYNIWDDWPIFMISGSNEQLKQQLEYTLLKPGCECWWISEMQSGCEDTLEERYTIKFCFKLGKNATETCGMLQTTFRLRIYIYIYIYMCVSPVSDHCSLIKMQYIYIYIYIYIYKNQNYEKISLRIRGSLNKFPGFFRMPTFIDSTHMKL